RSRLRPAPAVYRGLLHPPRRRLQPRQRYPAQPGLSGLGRHPVRPAHPGLRRHRRGLSASGQPGRARTRSGCAVACGRDRTTGDRARGRSGGGVPARPAATRQAGARGRGGGGGRPPGGADVLLVSPEVTPALEELPAHGRIDWRRRAYAAGDCAGAWLVIACTSSPEANAAVAEEAEANRTWCVRADDAAAATAWTPATGTTGDTSVGVLSGDPRHSAAIRDAITAGPPAGASA